MHTGLVSVNVPWRTSNVCSNEHVYWKTEATHMAWHVIYPQSHINIRGPQLSKKIIALGDGVQVTNQYFKTGVTSSSTPTYRTALLNILSCHHDVAFTERELKNGLGGCLRAHMSIGCTRDTNNVASRIVPEVYLVIDK